jgi:hypothetical protein
MGVCVGYLAAASVSAGSEENPAAFRFEKAEGKYLHLFEGEKPVLTYNYGMLLKEGVPEDRRRSCYIHPVYGLDGEVLTDDFPADHLHHRGLCWVWPRVIVGGKEYDLWDIRGVEQRFERWGGEHVCPKCAVFSAEAGWYVGANKIVSEAVCVQVFPASEKGRAIGVALILQATKQPVTISGREPVKGYGGFSFRFAPREETVITPPAGKESADTDLKRNPWADLSAKFAGRETFSGVAIFDHNENPGFPNGWTLRHYGFLGVAWPGLEFHTLKPGEPLTLRYLVYIHRGRAEEGDVAAYAASAEVKKEK